MFKGKIVLLFVFCSLAAMADPVSGTLYYTTFSGAPNIHKVDYSFNGSTFTLSNNTDITTTNGADGIIFAPDGNLLVGGQSTGQVHEITKGGAFVKDANANTGSYHLALDPSLGFLYTSFCCDGGSNPLSTVPLSGGGLSGGAGTTHTVSGSVPSITGIAFIGSQAYYTDSGAGGTGSFGKLNTSTFVTTELISGLPAAHGIDFDSFTGDLILFGSNHITQIDATGAIVSDYTAASGCSLEFDQGAVDGNGHILAACNGGELVFIDYSASHKVGDAGNFVSSQFLAVNLDDVAPLSGLGSNPVPEPSSVLLLGSVLAGFVAYRRRRRSQTI